MGFLLLLNIYSIFGIELRFHTNIMLGEILNENIKRVISKDYWKGFIK